MSDDTLCVWHAVSADWPETELESHFGSSLSTEERRAMQQFVRLADRRLYLLAHGLLRHALGQATGHRPDDIRIHHAESGKPYLPGGPHFSLAHTRGPESAGATTVAVSTSPVGIDIESRARAAELADLASTHFAGVERQMLEAVSAEEREERLVWLWTAKEAVVKATGAGMRTPLCTVAVAWGEDGTMRFEDWQLTRIRFGAFLGTIASRRTSSVVLHPPAVPARSVLPPSTTIEVIP